MASKGMPTAPLWNSSTSGMSENDSGESVGLAFK